jgi:hypothetical protein
VVGLFCYIYGLAIQMFVRKGGMNPKGTMYRVTGANIARFA